MIRLLWDNRKTTGGPAEFDPDKYRPALARVAAVTGVSLCFETESRPKDEGRVECPVRLGGRRTGWVVVADGRPRRALQVAEVAAEIVNQLLTADNDMASLAGELADRYEELNFLYDMFERVGAFLSEDEICAFVIQEAAWLLECERGSIMSVDPERGELRIRAAVGLPESISRQVTVKPGERISGKVFETGNGVIVNAGDPMPADSLNLNELSEANCFLSVPLKISSQTGRPEQVLGVINLTRKRGASAFTASDLKLVTAMAGTAATQIHNCRLINAERQRQQLEHELELAARIQLSLLPEHPLRSGQVEVGGFSRPSRHVGGDLFDYWLSDGVLCVVVADVSGHDMGAALMATALRSVIRSEASHRTSVAGLLQQVNRALLTDLIHSELLATAFYMEIDVATGHTTFCRAGHCMPLLLRGEDAQWLDTQGLLLGLQQDGGFEQQSVQLAPGDAVVLYTDGLMEAQDAQKRLFDTAGVRRAAIASLDLRPKEMAVKVVDAARDHADPSLLTDDMTAVVVRFGQDGQRAAP